MSNHNKTLKQTNIVIWTDRSAQIEKENTLLNINMPFHFEREQQWILKKI